MILARCVDFLEAMSASVVQMSWQASIVALLVLFVQWGLGRRLPAVWRHALWALVLVRLIVPFSPQSPLSVFNFLSASRVDPRAASERIETPSLESESPLRLPSNTDPARSVATPERGIARQSSALRLTDRARQAAPWIWLLGVGWLGIRTASAGARLAREISRMPAVADERLRNVLGECSRHLGMSAPRRMVVGPPGSEVGITGLLRPTMIMPPEVIAGSSESDLRNILLHELTHLRRGDLLWNAAAVVASQMHWFNPLVWHARRCVRVDAELACDAQVLATLSARERSEYGETLMRLLEASTGATGMRPALTVLGNKRSLHRRLTMIARYKAVSFREVLWGVAAAATIALTTMTQGMHAVAQQEPAAPKAQPPAASVAATVDPAKGEPPEAPKDLLMHRLGFWGPGGTARLASDIRRLTPGEKYRTVFLRGSRITDADLERLTEHPEIEELAIYETVIEGPGLRQLAALPKLRKLALFGSGCTDRWLDSLPELPELTSLTLIGTSNSASGLKILAKLKRLDDLSLILVKVDKGLEHLRELPNLTSLYLEETDLTDAGFAQLSSVARLELLSIGPAQLSDEGLEVLGRLKELRRLFLKDVTGVNGPGLRHLVAASHLKDFSLIGAGVTDEWLRAVEPLRNVDWLQIAGTRVTGSGLAALRGWSKLKDAYLQRNQIDDEAAGHLAEAYRLNRLDLRDNVLTEVGKKKVTAALPDTQISY